MLSSSFRGILTSLYSYNSHKVSVYSLKQEISNLYWPVKNQLVFSMNLRILLLNKSTISLPKGLLQLYLISKATWSSYSLDKAWPSPKVTSIFVHLRKIWSVSWEVLKSSPTPTDTPNVKKSISCGNVPYSLFHSFFSLSKGWLSLTFRLDQKLP